MSHLPLPLQKPKWQLVSIGSVDKTSGLSLQTQNSLKLKAGDSFLVICQGGGGWGGAGWRICFPQVADLDIWDMYHDSGACVCRGQQKKMH